MISIPIIFLLSLSFLALVPIATPAIAATSPVISPPIGSYEAGATVKVTVTWTGTGPYEAAIYSSPTDSCIGPASGWTQLGSNITTSGSTISFTAPNAPALYVCASVYDSGIPSNSVGGPATYVLVSPLSSYINNDENTVAADIGATVTLTDYVSGGIAPYSYAWYSGDACSGPVLATTNPYAFTVAGPTGPQVYSVFVTDSTSPGGPSTSCEVVTVNVETAFTPTFSIDGSSTVISGQVGSPALEAVVTFVGGSPWYAVTIYSGTDSVCANDKTVVASQNDINASEAILSFPEPSTPSSITYYCAVVSDITGNTVTLGPVQVDITPALSTPTLTISPTSIDYGNPTALPYIAATVSWAGGNAPYFVVLTSGSQSSCAAPDNVPEYPIASTGTLWTGTPSSSLASEYVGLGYEVFYTSGITMGFELPVPSSTTYYCAIVFDSSAPASQTYTAAGAEFLIEGLFAVNPPALTSYSTEVQTPVYEGTPDTATVTWSGGSGPFVVTLYQAPSAGTCSFLYPIVTVTPGSNPLTGVTGDSASFTFLAPNTPGMYYYCAIVVDATGNVVYSTTSSPLVVATYLAVGATTISGAASIDVGQTEMITISTSWSGGSAPYTATLYSGATATSCTTKIASETETGMSASFMITSPNVAITYFCIGVTDSSIPVSSGTSTPTVFTEVAAPTVTLPAGYEIEAGSSTVITAVATNTGVLPDTFTWFIGAGCQSGAQIYVGNPYSTGVLTTTTTYSVLLTDSSTGTPAMSSCASITITVNDGPTAVVAVNSGPFAGMVYSTCTSSAGLCVIDTDSNSLITVIPLYGGFSSTAINTADPLTSINGLTFDSGNNFIWVSGTDHAGVGFVCDVNIATNTERSCLGPSQGVSGIPEGLAYDSGLARVFAAESGVNLVYVYNEATDTAASYAVGAGPLNVAVDQNTHTVFVTDFGSDTVSVLQPNLIGGYTVTTVTVGFEPFGVAVDPATDNVWVTNYGAGTVSVLSGTNYNVLQTIKVGGNPTGIAISDANNEALVSNAATNTVTPIGLTTFAPGTAITVGSTPEGIATFLSSVGGIPSLAYVANAGSNTVSVINLATDAVIATIILPG